MSELRVFSSEYDWWVASSLDEVLDAQAELLGSRDPDDIGEWVELAATAEIRIWVDLETGDIADPEADGVVCVSGEAQVWAEAYGPGFLCTSEF